MLVKAHGKAVGLPTDDDMGNSEVGHNALGAGRIFAQGYNSYTHRLILFGYGSSGVLSFVPCKY